MAGAYGPYQHRWTTDGTATSFEAFSLGLGAVIHESFNDMRTFLGIADGNDLPESRPVSAWPRRPRTRPQTSVVWAASLKSERSDQALLMSAMPLIGAPKRTSR